MIPKTFKLVNRDWRVVRLADHLAEDLGVHGDCERAKAIIRIKMDDCADATFYHELAHALLYVSTRPKLSKDEDFVESLGSALHQFMLTRKGALK